MLATSTPSLAATADSELEIENSLLAGDFYALMAVTADGEQGNIIIGSPAMSVPLLAVTAIRLAI